MLKNINSLYYPNDRPKALPKVIMIEPTNACNLKCAMCYVQQNIKANHYLGLSAFKAIIEQFPEIRELIFCGIGEPLLNKDIFAMIEVAKKRGIGFINLVTNGKLLDKEMAFKIISSGINRIQISVQSFNPKAFSEIRNEEESNLERLKLDIKELIKQKKELNSGIKICCNAVITKFNYDDISAFIKEAKELGADRVEFIQMTTASGNLMDLNAPLASMADICKKARSLAQMLNIEIGFLNGNEYGRCYQLWDFMMIHADGEISPCNGIFPTENIGVGNIFNDPIEKIWNSKRYQGLRRGVKNGELKYCRYCESGYCMEGKDLRWFKNYYLRPLKRLIRGFICLQRIKK